MTGAIERVAQAIDPGAFAYDGPTYAERRADALVAARDAIEAMREPESATFHAAQKPGVEMRRFVNLTETLGNPVCLNADAVESMRKGTATETVIRLKSGKDIVVQGTLEAVSYLINGEAPASLR